MERVLVFPSALLSLGQLLASHEADLLRHVNAASVRELVRIYRLGLICRCSWFPKLGYGMRACRCVACGGKRPLHKCSATPDGEGCVSGAELGENAYAGTKFLVCEHDETLPPSVCAAVLARLWPRQYSEPPLDLPSAAVSKDERMALMLDRARRNRRLGHPLDAQQAGLDGLPDGFGLKVNRKRNGGICEVELVRVQG